LSLLRFARLERVVDIARHVLRVGAHALLRGIVRHVLIDVTRQLLDRPIPAQSVVVFALRTFAIPAVAFGAELAEDVAAFVVLFRAAHPLLALKQEEQRQHDEALNRSARLMKDSPGEVTGSTEVRITE